jgi:hypothetical protein
VIAMVDNRNKRVALVEIDIDEPSFVDEVRGLLGPDGPKSVQPIAALTCPPGVVPNLC